MGLLQWYAVRTKPRQEAVAEVFLSQSGLETFHPKIAPAKSLFTSYIFAKFDAETQVRLVRYSKGVSSIVSFGDKPASLDESLIDAIKVRIKDGLVRLDPPSFTKGERVEIKEGPLEGVTGIFDSRIKDSDRVIILLNAIASQSRVVIPATNLRKVSRY